MNAEHTNGIKQKAIKSVKWTALGEIASRSIQPLVILILARFLSPADFGIIGVAMIAIGLAQILQDFGLGKTLIQRETDVEESANVIFWTNIIFSVSIYLIIYFTAPLLAIFFNEPGLVTVLRVLCLQIILFSLISVHQALFQRDFQFRKLFFIRLASAGMPGIISIPLALSGYGVWSLVFGTLAGALFQVLIYWKASPWRPHFQYDFKLARKLVNFSSWIAMEAFLGWIIMWGDSIVLGHFLGVKELGVYRIGVTAIFLIFGIFFNPVLPIAYSAFSRLQADRSELRTSFLRITKIIASVSLPIGIVLVVLYQPIASLFFGHKWQGIGMVIALIGLKDAISWIVGLNPEVYKAIGRPDVNSKLYLILVLYYIPVYLIAAPYGLVVFCVARLIVSAISVVLHVWLSKRYLQIGYLSFLRNLEILVIAACSSGIAVYFARKFIPFPNVVSDLLISSGVLVLIYATIVYLQDRKFTYDSFRLLLSAGKG
jgi:O-antigen/teichoic acid export membrane protein